MITGNVTISINNEKKRLNAGDSILLLPGRYEFFQFDTMKNSTHDWCQLDFEYIPDDFNEHFIDISSRLNSDNQLDHLINTGLNMQIAMLNCDQTLLKLAEATFHYYIESALSTNTQQELVNKRFILAKQFIENNYHTQLTLKDISEHIYYSIPHLIHLFKVHLSTTPANYLRQIRIKQAKKLLSETNETITLVAERCGFASLHHFTSLVYLKKKWVFRQNISE